VTVYRKIEALGTIQAAMPAISSAHVAVDPLPAAATLTSPPRDAFLVVVERPIFSQSRRPVPPPANAGPQIPAPTLDFELTGVVISSSERFALVHMSKGGGVVRVGQPASVSGWEVIAIEPDRVLFRNGRLEQEIQLKFKAPQNDGKKN
jgi:hypothetical protein